MSRPVLLTVDDDPAVSRAVARDLRRRFGEDHRVVRAEDPQAALDALSELKERGEAVALLLVDHRMPGMTGVELLERAADLAPTAKRVLLTAYADTEAAISAINDVGLDRYLLKPWDPPEEKLFPPVEDLLAAWRDDRARQGDDPGAVRVLGSRWSAASHAARDLLARNGVPYRWVDVERQADEVVRLLGEGAHLPDEELPVVVVPGRTPLRAPSRRDLASAVGLPTELEGAGRTAVADPVADDALGDASQGGRLYDVVVVGGGPAGLGAAVYAASEGLETVLLEAEAAGGQAGQSSLIENYLGFPRGLSGSDLADRAQQQARRFGVQTLLADDVVRLCADGPRRRLQLESGRCVDARSVVLAPGVSYRRLEVVDGWTGRGVYYGAATTEAQTTAGKDVYVVGGANSAGQAALYFAQNGARVHVLVRGDDLAAGMSDYLVQRCYAHESVTVQTQTEVVASRGDGHLTGLTLRGPDGDTDVDTEHLFVFIGAAPRTDWLDGAVERDAKGFLVCGPDLLRDGSRPAGWSLPRDPYYLETSVAGVFAAGDVRLGSVKRVASAVGEGAMATTLVHRYLEET